MTKRYKMTRIERAKQFAPFDALTGLGAAIKAKEKECELVRRHELSEDELKEINDALCVLEVDDVVRVNYYCAGEYFDVIGSVSRVDEARKVLHLSGEDSNISEDFEISIPFVDIKTLERM